MRISEYDAFVSEHSELEVVIDSAPGFTLNGRTFGALNSQLPGGWKDVLQKLGEKNPHTNLGDEYRKNKTIKEIKTRDIVREYSKKQAKAKKDAKRK